MKIKNTIIVVIILVLSVMMFTACGKSEFGVTENTGKLMTITANKADKDAFFMVGSLDVADGEMIEITPDLSEGLVKVEVVAAPEEQTADELPETDGEAFLSSNFSNNGSISGTVPEGSYMVRATCLEKATGTIDIEVKPAS